MNHVSFCQHSFVPYNLAVSKLLKQSTIQTVIRLSQHFWMRYASVTSIVRRNSGCFLPQFVAAWSLQHTTDYQNRALHFVIPT